MKLRNVTRVLEPGELESEEYFAIEGAPKGLLVRVDANKH